MSTSLRKIDSLLTKARALYIINESGLLEHYENFTDNYEDPDLYSALFATVHMYSKQLGGGDMELISLENHKFAFSQFEGKLIVLNIDTDMAKEDGIYLISQIMDRFEQMEKLMHKAPEGGIVLQTLFGERGKSINWNTIRAIQEEAITEKLKTTDLVETTNITRINIKSKIWIKIRQIITSMASAQKDLLGIFLLIKKDDHISILFSGRAPPDQLDGIKLYCLNLLEDPMSGVNIEPEFIEMDDKFCSIYPTVAYEGGMIALVANDKFTISRLSNLLERVLVAIERLIS
jgi:hypothetical protein